MKNLLESKLITDVQWEEYQRLKELEEEHRQINGELRVKISNLEAEKATLLDILRLDNKIMSENEEIKEDLLKIIEHYGLMKQLKYIHSEYFELDEAILDYEKSGWDFSDDTCLDIERDYINHITEELADIMVMLKQFQYYYRITDEQIENIMKTKIERQLNRISLEKGEIEYENNNV